MQKNALAHFCAPFWANYIYLFEKKMVFSKEQQARQTCESVDVGRGTLTAAPNPADCPAMSMSWAINYTQSSLVLRFPVERIVKGLRAVYLTVLKKLVF